MKKVLSTAIVISIVLCMLTACNTNGTTQQTNGYGYIPQKEFETTEIDEIKTKLIGDETATGVLNIANFGNSLEYKPANMMRILEAIKLYNELYPNVKVVYDVDELPTGWTGNEFQDMISEYTKRISAEIMAGKGPDIVFLQSTFDMVKMSKSGAFADMSEYFNNDEFFDENEYNKAVLYGGQPKGKQYIIPLSYNFPTVLTTQENLEQTGFSVDNCSDYVSTANGFDKVIQKLDSMSIARTMPQRYFPFSYDNQGIVGWSNIFDQQIDVKTPDIKKYLTTNKQVFYKYIDESPVSFSTYFETALNLTDDSFEFLETTNHGNEDIAKFSTILMALKQKPVVFGWKNYSGNLVASSYEMVAVNENCQNKENAYRFVKVLLSHEIQFPEKMISELEQTPNSHFPISIVAFKKELLQKMKDETIDYGNEIVDYGALTNEFILNYLKLVQSVDRFEYGNEGNNIFMKEVEPYLKGEKSYDECIKSAQDKLEIYISE